MPSSSLILRRRSSPMTSVMLPSPLTARVVGDAAATEAQSSQAQGRHGQSRRARIKRKEAERQTR